LAQVDEIDDSFVEGNVDSEKMENFSVDEQSLESISLLISANDEDVASDCANLISFRKEVKDKIIVSRHDVSRACTNHRRGRSLFDMAGHKFVFF